MSEKPDDEHWFWKFLLLPGPPWETARHPLAWRGVKVVAAILLAVMAIVVLLTKLFCK